MGYEVTTAPTDYPITVDEAKVHLNIQSSDFGSKILASIAAATEKYQIDTGERQLMRATYKMYLDRFPKSSFGVIRPPRSPLSSVSSITYVDTDGATQTWSSAEYLVDTKSLPGRITLGYSFAWPVTRPQNNAVTITFLAGYADQASIPEIDKAAIRLLVSHFFEHLGPTSDRPVSEFPLSYCSIANNRHVGSYQ